MAFESKSTCDQTQQWQIALYLPLRVWPMAWAKKLRQFRRTYAKIGEKVGEENLALILLSDCILTGSEILDANTMSTNLTEIKFLQKVERYIDRFGNVLADRTNRKRKDGFTTSS